MRRPFTLNFAPPPPPTRTDNLFISECFHGTPPAKIKQLLGDDAGGIDNAKCLELLGVRVIRIPTRASYHRASPLPIMKADRGSHV